jgi:co-chaperonin GroES (HSP10)
MRLQGNTVLIKPDAPATVKGSIHLPVSNKKAHSGMVLDTGPGCDTVKSGDRVHYTPKKAHHIDIKGIEHHFIPEGDVAYIY